MLKLDVDGRHGFGTVPIASWRPKHGRGWVGGLVLGLALVAGCAQPSSGAAGGASERPAGTVLPAGAIASPSSAPLASTPMASLPPAAEARPNPRPDCPRLDPEFRQLLAAPDPAAFAAQRAPSYRDGRVEVNIFLAHAEGDLAHRYGLQVIARTPTLVEASAPLTTLCELSNDPRVRSVDRVARTGY
jgi:hypothetical protein